MRTISKQAGMRFDAPILSSRLSDLFLLFYIVLFPFVNLISSRVLGSFSLGGVSFLNAVFMVGLVLICVFQLLGHKKARETLLLCISAAMFFVMLLKLLLQGCEAGFVQWLSQCQYYFFVPLFAFAMINSKIPITFFGRVSVYVSIPVCLASIYSFLTNDYFGLVSQSVGAEYAIVGTGFMRMMGLFSSPNVAASYYLVMLVLCSSEMEVRRGVLWVVRSLLLICLILTFSRAAMIAFLLLYGIRLAFDGGVGQFRTRKLLLPLALGLLLVAVPVAVEHGIYFWSPGEDFFHNPRLLKWASGLSIISHNLFLGAEFSYGATAGSWETTLSDNSFLLCASGFGVFACAIFYGGLFWALFRGCWYGMRRWTFLGLVVVMLFFYDFINFYPVNYLLVVATLLESSSSKRVKNIVDDRDRSGVTVHEWRQMCANDE